MKAFLYFIAIFSLYGFIACFAQTPSNGVSTINSAGEPITAATVKNKTPVLVELFTSEGCATCPPADKILAMLDKEQPNPDAEIITLALHVDYWNRAGWTDEFSSPLYSQRQEIYGDKFKIASVFTPQMVVDGSRHFVGSNLGEAQKVISESAKTPKAKVELSAADDKLKVKISDLPKHENAAVFLAIAESNLSNNVKRGENAGRLLEHSSVVRELKPLGRILAEQKEFDVEVVLQLQPNWKKGNLKAVVFVQENQSRKILGVTQRGF